MVDIERQLASLDPAQRKLLEMLLTEEGIEIQQLSAKPKEEIDPLPPHPAGQSISGEDVLARVAFEVKHLANKDLMIYIHVPFCSSKCLFCDWVVDIPVKQLLSGPSVRREYIEALCKQIEFFGPRLTKIGYRSKHIYWGGGTPSRLEADEIQKVIAALKGSFDLSELDEHTMETSPETLTLAKLKAVRAAGVNRISMGVQSFNDKELRKAGRSHSAQQAEESARMIREAGFSDFNLDLIAGFPDQTLEMLKSTLLKTIELEPGHVSVYIYRPNQSTVMADQIKGGRRKATTIEEMFDYYSLSKSLLEQAGYSEYTTGYFAKEKQYHFKGEEYYFNLCGDYIGFGSGAQSLIGHHRLLNSDKNLHQFISEPTGFGFCEKFSSQNLESILFPLRETMLTEKGIIFENFYRTFGIHFSEIREHPYVKSLIHYYTFCGARFEETKDRLFISPETRSNAYIVSLSRAFKIQGNESSQAKNSDISISDRFPLDMLQTATGETVPNVAKDGKAVVFFYPKDDTPGCTIEAREFSTAKEAFDRLGVPVYGVSCDDALSHQSFCNKYNLTLDLLIDRDGVVGKKLGIIREGRLQHDRTTYILGPDNVVLKVYNNVNPVGHAADVLSLLQSL